MADSSLEAVRTQRRGGGWLIFRPPLEASREPSWSVLGQFCAVSGRPKRLRCFLLTFPAIQHRTISVQLTALLSFRGGVDAAGVPLSLTRVLNFAHYVPEAHCFRYVRTCVYVLAYVTNWLAGNAHVRTLVVPALRTYVRAYSYDRSGSGAGPGARGLWPEARGTRPQSRGSGPGARLLFPLHQRLRPPAPLPPAPALSPGRLAMRKAGGPITYGERSVV